MKQCKTCSEPFEPKQAYNSTIKTNRCDVCLKTAQALKNLASIKKEKKAKQKEDLLTLQDYLKMTQAIVNKYIRLRDKDEKCISCGKEIKGVEHASHYMSSGGHANIRFHEDNIWKSCYKCNVMLSGNQLEYRKRLIKKIGIERVDWLEENGSVIRKYTKEELKEISAIYKKKIKEMQL